MRSNPRCKRNCLFGPYGNRCRENIGKQFRGSNSSSCTSVALRFLPKNLLKAIKDLSCCLTHMRYRIGTTLPQLVQRFHSKRVWVRALWQLSLLGMVSFSSTTLKIYFCSRAGICDLNSAPLITTPGAHSASWVATLDKPTGS